MHWRVGRAEGEQDNNNNNNNDTLFIALRANHNGWLGLGFAEDASGHMKGSDIVTVQVVDGEARVQVSK